MVRKVKLPGVISLRKALPIWPMEKGSLVLAAVGAGDVVILDILEHLLLGHAVGMGLGVKVVDQIVRPEAHFALLAVQQGVGEALHMAAGLPDPGVHEDVRVHLVAVAPLLDEALAPGVLHVVLEPRAQRAVVPGVGKATVNLAAGEDEAAVFAQGDDLVHGFFGVVHHVRSFPAAGCRRDEIVGKASAFTNYKYITVSPPRQEKTRFWPLFPAFGGQKLLSFLKFAKKCFHLVSKGV